MLHWSYIGATLQCIGATLWILGKGSPQNRGNTSPWAEQCGLNIAISRSQMQIKRSPIPLNTVRNNAILLDTEKFQILLVAN